MQRRASLVQGLFASFALSQLVAAGCAQPASGGGTGGATGNGGSNSGNGGSNNTGGNGSPRGGSNGNGGSTPGSGGITGAGGTNPGAGGSHTGGTTGGGGNPGTGGGGPATGGSNGTGGSPLGGSSGNRACGAPASGDVIADFEEGTNQDVAQGMRQGWWSAFGDSAGTQTPASGSTPSAAAMVTGGVPTGDTCDMFAFHSTATGHAATSDSSYVGFAGAFSAVLPPPAATSKTVNPYDVSAFDGVSFNIKSGSGTAPPVWVEFQNTQNVPAPDGTAKYDSVDSHNTRGMLLTNVGTSWTKVFVPFAILAPRYLPSTTSTDCSNGSVLCQAPPWDSKNTLKIQFGVYPQFAVAPFTSTPTLNYDLWVDDVAFYKGSDGLGTWTSTTGTAHPFPQDKAVGTCAKPAAASGKYLVQMYNNWKKTFVTGSGSSTRVQRPENGNDTVSEGIGYGMLIAAYMGDQTLFDGLWGYGKAHGTGAGTLMTWCVPGGANTCSGSGSATDADEDMAFALIQAGKQWGGTYASDAAKMISDIWAHDIDTAAMLPNGGSNFGNGMRTNPSYWAPAYYRVFATVDSGHAWTTVADNTYTALNAIAGKSSSGGLVPAWCSGASCGNVDAGSYTDGGVYQYDAHRVPWRFGIDACWNGKTTPFLGKNASFFEGIAKNGVGRIADIYTLSGTPNSDSAPNSMSIIGTAGVGAMAAGSGFANTAWQFLLDSSYSPQSQIKDKMGHVGYTYYNATVGLITALTLSGNFNNF